MIRRVKKMKRMFHNSNCDHPQRQRRHQQQQRPAITTRKRRCRCSCGIAMMVTVAVTATVLVQTGVTLILSLPTTTASDKIMYRRLSFQATIILKQERQQRVRLWTDANHDGNNLIRKEHSVVSGSYGNDTMTSLIGHFRSSRLDHEPKKLPYTPLDMLGRLEQENTDLKKLLRRRFRASLMCNPPLQYPGFQIT